MSQGIPRQIGRYTVEDEIGRGGFGRVYRAVDPTVGRLVAIKVLTESSTELLTRFQNEAAVAGNLRHQNIVTLYEFGEYDGKPFLAMEYLEGQTLADIIASGKPLTLLEKLNIMSQAAEGLYCAHRAGVVHRDVKPANIMVLPDGRVKIMDFGIAKVTRSSESTKLTKEGFVVGTLLYMSPEQLKGLIEVDAICDIFAYGVIYYELVVGKHPFAGPDSQSVMYNLTFNEPPPIREAVPDFPDALEAIISRTIAKDRDLRYSSLKQVQFDVDPIKLDLQQQRASDVLLQAQDLIAKQQLEPAQNLILQVLELDPSNRVARSLWDSLQRRSQQRVLQPRIESLLKSAEEHLTQRRYSEAVRSFDSALRLDRENKYIQDKIAHSKALLEHSKKVAGLLAEARKLFTEQNLTGASRTVSEALREDPEHPEVVDLLRAISTATDRRQREQRIDEAISKAESLLERTAYDEAIATLEELGKDAETSRVKLFLSVVQSAKAEEEQKQKFRTGMAAASDLLQNRRLSDAVSRLEQLQHDFPDDTEVANLLSYAKGELEADTRNKLIEKAASKSGQLIGTRDFDGAVSVLDQALKSYPGNSRLVGLLGAALSAKTNWEHERAVLSLVGQATALRAQQRYAESIGVVEAALREFAGEPALLQLLEALKPELDRQRRNDTVQKVEEATARFIRDGQPERAVQLVQGALKRYPGDPAFVALLSRTEEAQGALEKSRAIEAIQSEIDARAKANDISGALAAVEEGLAAWPDEFEFLEQKEKFLAARREVERQQGMQDAFAESRQLMSERQFEKAAARIDKALSAYGSDVALTSLAEENTRAWVEHEQREEVRAIVSAGQKSISEGHPDEALDALNKGLLKYPAEASIAAVASQAKQVIEARERKAAVARTVKESQDALANREFERAARMLEQGLLEHSGEQDLSRALDEVRTAERAWQRDLAIQKALEDAKRLAASALFPEAFEALDTALGQFKGEPLLLKSRAQVEDDHKTYKRREAVAKAAAEAMVLLDQGRVDDAAHMLRTASTQYPGEPEWPPLILEVEQALEKKAKEDARAKAVRDIQDEARELARNRKFETALEKLAVAVREYPENAAALKDQQDQLKTAWEQDKRAQAIAQEVERVKISIEQGRLDEAVKSLDALRQQYPGEGIFDALLESARKQIQQREIRTEATKKAEKLIQQSQFQDALTVLDQALAKVPGDAGLVSLRGRASSRLEEIRQREEGIRQAVEAARALARQKRFDEGLQKIAAAVKQYGEEPPLAALRTELRTAQGLAAARALLSKSRPADALKAIESLGTSKEVAALKAQAQEQLATQERAAAIEKHAESAREKATAGDLESAMAMLDEGLRKWPGAESLVQLRERVATARMARQRQETISDAVRQGQDLRQQNRLDTALQYVQKVLEQFDNEPALVDLRAQIQTDLLEREQRQKRQQTLQEVERIAAALSNVASLSEVARLSLSLRALPSDEEVRSAAEDSFKLISDIENAKRALDAGDFDSVRTICGRHPGHALFEQFRDEAELRQKRQFIDALLQRAASEMDLSARAALLEGGLKRFPAEESIVAELAATRNQLALLNETLGKARAAEGAKQWDDALQHWNRVATIHSAYPNLNAEIDRVRRTLESVRAEQISTRVRAIESKIATGEFAKAGELAKRAQTEIPDVPVFTDLARHADDSLQRRSKAKELVSQARQAIASDWRRASALLAEATSTDAGFAIPEDLTRAVAAKQRDDLLSHAADEAARLRHSGDLHSAVTVIDQALATHGHDARLKGLSDILKTEIHRKQDALKDELRGLYQSAQAESNPAALQTMLQRSAALATEGAGDPEVASLALAASQTINARLKQTRKSVVPKTLAAVVAGGLVVVVGGWLAVRSFTGSGEGTKLNIKALPGVAIHIGEQDCKTPDCNLTLKPGTYALKASKGGYQTIAKNLTIAADQKQLDVPLELLPLPELVQVNTNFERGSVVIDGRPARALSNGQFASSGLPPGKHTIRVTGSDGEFQAEWQSAIGVRPELTGPIRATNLLTTVITSAGGDAAIACNCGAENVTVDGAPVGKTSASAGVAAPISHLAEGARQIAVAGRSLVLNVTPNPALNIFLSVDRNVGTLVIETGQESARVFLNNRFFRQTGADGIVRMPLDVGSYSIKVEKEGFRHAAPQTIEVSKGAEKRVTFALDAIPAVFEIAGALPGAQVKVDQRTIGQVAGSGTFKTESIAAGRHALELTSDGYNPVRLEFDLNSGKTTRVDGARVAMAKINRPPPPPDIEAQDWDRVRSAGVDELEAFIRKHPSGPHAEEARTRAAALRQQSQKNTDESAWQAVDKSKKSALEEFASTHPNSPHASEARAAINRLDKERERLEAEAAAADKRAKDKERADRESNRSGAAQQEAIRRAIGTYESAYSRMDIQGVRASWNGIPESTAQAIGRQFQFARSVTLTLHPLGPATISGDTATVNCDRALSVVTKDSKKPVGTSDHVRVTLGSTGSGWTIRAITPY